MLNLKLSAKKLSMISLTSLGLSCAHIVPNPPDIDICLHNSEVSVMLCEGTVDHTRVTQVLDKDADNYISFSPLNWEKFSNWVDEVKRLAEKNKRLTSEEASSVPNLQDLYVHLKETFSN